MFDGVERLKFGWSYTSCNLRVDLIISIREISVIVVTEVGGVLEFPTILGFYFDLGLDLVFSVRLIHGISNLGSVDGEIECLGRREGEEI